MAEHQNDEIARLAAEIERLRAALKEISECDPSYDYDAAERLKEIAEKALGETQ